MSPLRKQIGRSLSGPDGRLFTGGLDTVALGCDVRPPRAAARGPLADVWDALAESDAKAAFQAQGRFLAEPARAVEWLAARVSPAAQPAPAQVKVLIADLDDPTFATRERATAQMKEFWPATAAALREVAARSPSAEARRWAEGLVREMENGSIPSRELRALRAVEVLEWIETPEARARLLELAEGARTRASPARRRQPPSGSQAGSSWQRARHREPLLEPLTTRCTTASTGTSDNSHRATAGLRPAAWGHTLRRDRSAESRGASDRVTLQRVGWPEGGCHPRRPD